MTATMHAFVMRIFARALARTLVASACGAAIRTNAALAVMFATAFARIMHDDYLRVGFD